MSEFISIVGALRSVLLESEAIKAIVDQRIYQKILPQNPKMPLILINSVDDVPHNNIYGEAGLFEAVIQFDYYSPKNKPNIAIQLKELARLKLQGYDGLALGVEIKGVILLSEIPGNFESDLNENREIARYQVWYYRKNPSQVESDS